jgi:hypothetical protein
MKSDFPFFRNQSGINTTLYYFNVDDHRESYIVGVHHRDLSFLSNRRILMKAFLLGIGLIAVVPLTALAADDLVTFKGGIGVDPVQGTTGTAPSLTVVQNIVRGVKPPAAPWRITNLSANIDVNGSILVKGRGLLVAGGDGIGTTGVVKNVIAELFCGPAASATEFDSTAEPLGPRGNFDIDTTLSTTPPNPCTDPVLLIVASTPSGPGPWLAAAIPTNGE